MTLTFMDAGALIAGSRGNDPNVVAATVVLADSNRQFVSSPFVRLEVIPKAIYHRNSDEVEFYELFFAGVTVWVDDLAALVAEAELQAARLGLVGMDALHLAAALIAGADELVTTEGPTKPIHRATDIRVVSLRTLLDQT